MSNLESVYKIYRNVFGLTALAAYIAVKQQVAGSLQPISSAKRVLTEKRLWVAKYDTRSGDKCEALQVMRDR